jgi:ribonucleotide reductase alpha subunit
MSVEKKFVECLPTLFGRVEISHVTGYDADFVVPDNREGWCELLYRVLKAHFTTGKGFTYSTSGIRPYGDLIKGFGGTASGPLPLIQCITKINKLLNNAGNRKLTSVEAGDIMTLIGEMVVAGNVRRSAIILLGDCDDVEFLKAKNWSLGNIPNNRAFANYSIVIDHRGFNGIHPEYWQTFLNGEAYGIFNRSYLVASANTNLTKPWALIHAL